MLFKMNLNNQVIMMIMKTKLITITFISGAIMLMTGCSKDDNNNPTPVVPVVPVTPGYSVPSTYTFTDASNVSTVSFNGQQQRLEMLSEMSAYAKTANTLGTAVSATTLRNMYANSGYTWTDTPGYGMTGSSKQLKSKTAAGDVGVQALFESYFDSLEVLSNLNYDNSAELYGQGGVWGNGVKNYLMSRTGIEYTQLIEKGLMCAVFMNQMTVNYLGTVGDDDNDNLVSGKNYTEMQHHWDEAYGYLTSEIDYPTSGTDRFWGKYVNSREAILGSATTLSDAFRRGRSAIDNKDYTTRDAQISIIRNEMEKVAAATAIHYLNEAKANIASPTIKNHVLSEAWAFIDGLRYGHNAVSAGGMTTSEINTALTYLTDFENISISDINNAIDFVASKTDLENVKNSL